MNVRRALVLTFLAAFCACTNPKEQDDPAFGTPDPTLTMDYQGPPIRAELEVMESEPPQFAVEVGVQAPTAGWVLTLSDVVVEDGATVVRVKLTAPSADALVAQVIQDLRIRVPLLEEPEVVHLRVSRWQRDVHYMVAPEAKLAAIVQR